MVTPLWFSRDPDSVSTGHWHGAFPGWLRHSFLSALRQSLLKPVNEIQNRAAEFALRRVVNHLGELGLYTSFLLHLTANYKMLSFLPEAGLLRTTSQEPPVSMVPVIICYSKGFFPLRQSLPLVSSLSALQMQFRSIDIGSRARMLF